MKVRIAYTVEVDVDRWRRHYQLEDFTLGDIRADMNETAENIYLDDAYEAGVRGVA